MFGLESIWMFFIFLAVSILGSLMGTAAGYLKVPTLIFYGYIIDAVAISLLLNLYISIPSTLIKAKRKLIDYRISVPLIIGSLFGTITGNLVYNLIMNSGLLLLYLIIFILFLLYVAIRLLTSKENSAKIDLNKNKSYKITKKIFLIVIFIGYSAGFLSTIFGIGGGIVITPSLTIIFNFNIKKSVGTSFFVMNFTSCFGIIENIIDGKYTMDSVMLAIFLGIGIIIGALIGSYISKKAKPKHLKYIFVAIIFGIAIPFLLISYFNPIF